MKTFFFAVLLTLFSTQAKAALLTVPFPGNTFLSLWGATSAKVSRATVDEKLADPNYRPQLQVSVTLFDATGRLISTFRIYYTDSLGYPQPQIVRRLLDGNLKVFESMNFNCRTFQSSSGVTTLRMVGNPSLSECSIETLREAL